MTTQTNANDPYFVDFPARIKAIQAAMQSENLDVYLGSCLRSLSCTLDAFCPLRSFVAIPSEGLPTAFTFVIEAPGSPTNPGWTRTISWVFCPWAARTRSNRSPISFRIYWTARRAVSASKAACPTTCSRAA